MRSMTPPLFVHRKNTPEKAKKVAEKAKATKAIEQIKAPILGWKGK